MKKFVSLLIAVIVMGGQVAYADSSDQMMSMLESMKQQMTKMQDTIDRQNVRIQQLESRPAVEVPQYTPTQQPSSGSSATMSDADFQKSLKDNIGESVPWLKGLKLGGDFRLRYEAFDFDDNNEEETVSSDRSRNRFRIRLRYGVEKDFGDDWKVGFRLATATPTSSNPYATDNTSTNVTLGNPGYFTYKNIFIDRAYAVYTPNGLKDYGPLKGVSIGAGKFENPFLRYSTTIVWDGDVTPEGAYEKATVSLVSTEENKVNFYGTAGQFITHENSGYETDAGMYGYQGALSWSTYNFGTDVPVEFTGAVSYYDYYNWFQTVGATNNLATSFLRTNTTAADTFRVLDFYPEITFAAWDMPVTVWGNIVENVGNQGTESALSGGQAIHDANEAYGIGLKIGKAKAKGSWEASYGYYEIGANAVVAAFNDSDFGGPGGQGYTNRQGHKFGFVYQLTDAINVGWTGYVVTPLNPNTAVANSLNETVFRSQLDVVYKF